MIPVSDDALAAAVVGLHGLLDVATTGTAHLLGLFPALEGNPVVLALGPGRWLALNALAIIAFAGVFALVRGESIRVRGYPLVRAWLWALVLLGGLVVPNVPILGWAVVAG